MNKNNSLLTLLFAALFLIGCNKEEKVVQTQTATPTEKLNSPQAQIQDSAATDTLAAAPPKEVIGYTSVIVPSTKKGRDSVLRGLKEKYSEDELYTILALNRLDKKNINHADTLMIPQKFASDFRSYSPFPAKMNILSDVDKIVIFSYPIQAYGVYQKGELVKWGPSSMGKKSAQTKRGLMFANWKKELSISSVKSEWKLPYNFNIHNSLGIGWHEYDLPGYPASHSCLRLLRDDAKWLYNFADQWVLNKGGATTKAKGTPVIVFGDWGWGKAKPWKVLDKNPAATDVTEEELTGIIQPYKEEILKEQQNRAEVVASLPQVKKDSTGA